MKKIKKALFIRRDNIGDLVCTTPAITAFKRKYPEAFLGVLVNSYNAEILKKNPYVDKLFIYDKPKHSKGIIPKIKAVLKHLKVIIDIRKEKFDAAVACGSGYSFQSAKWAIFSGARYRIGYMPLSPKFMHKIIYNKGVSKPATELHETEYVMNLLALFDINSEIIPPLFIKADELQKKRLLNELKEKGLDSSKKAVAVHISSRKPSNRWSKEKFKELISGLQEKLNFNVILLWSPGKKDDLKHPGDDEKVVWIHEKLLKKPFMVATLNLTQLIVALDIADYIICLDGGAMHIAAALKKPLITIWGATNKGRWHPWTENYEIIQGSGNNAENVKADAVFKEFLKLSLDYQ